MRAADIIRNLLDLMDEIDFAQRSIPAPIEVVDTEPIETGVDSNRFKHIFAMLDAERNNSTGYDNSPNAVIASIRSVTSDAGGGWNGPKNPADMRANSISMYPNFQAENKGQQE